jgi:hypothetical protein
MGSVNQVKILYNAVRPESENGVIPASLSSGANVRLFIVIAGGLKYNPNKFQAVLRRRKNK